MLPPASSRIAVTSIDAHSDFGRRVNSEVSSPDARIHSRIHVDLVSRHAFQYVWNCSSDVGFEVRFRHVTTARPVMVRDAGSRSTSME